MLTETRRKTLFGLIVGVLMTLAAFILMGGLTQLDDLYLGGFLYTVDSISTAGNLRVGGTVTTTGSFTQSGRVAIDSSLVLGSTKYWNGGLYINVENKSGATLRVGAPVQWDGTRFTVTTIEGDSTTLVAGVAAIAAQGVGYFSFLWVDAGTNPNTDTLFITGTDQNGTAQIDTLNLNGSADSVWTTKIFKTVTAMKSRSCAGQTALSGSPLMGVTFASVFIDADTTTIKSYAGVVYPSIIADDAWGTILIYGVGKVLFIGGSGLVNCGSPLTVDSDSLGLASKYAGAFQHNGQNSIGYALQQADGGGSLTVAKLIWAFIDFR